MSKIIFISSADEKYAPLLREWIHNLRHLPGYENADIGIMNAGMTPETLKKLEPDVTKIVEPDWPCKLPEWKIRGREFLKACVARPFIPNYFPGYDLYFWMDCDVWVQNPKALDLFIEGGKRKKITLTGQVDRAYPRNVRVKWLGPIPWKMKGFYFTNAMKAYGFKTAKKLFPYHVLLAGAFCLHADAPHWQRWQELVVKTMKKGKVFTAEQLSLGIMCYLEGYKFELLPAWTHWLCVFKPLWDKGRGKFVEPFLPHEEIGILHLSGWDEMRLDRSLTTDFETTDGESAQLSYRYPDFDGGRSL